LNEKGEWFLPEFGGGAAVFAANSWPISPLGLPQERFYNLLCLAVGAHREVFADLEVYLPSTRSPRCVYEYRTLVHAFDKAFSPHIDREMANRVLNTDWLETLESSSIPQKMGAQ
jgi:hypothetical protein